MPTIFPPNEARMDVSKEMAWRDGVRRRCVSVLARLSRFKLRRCYLIRMVIRSDELSQGLTGTKHLTTKVQPQSQTPVMAAPRQDCDTAQRLLPWRRRPPKRFRVSSEIYEYATPIIFAGAPHRRRRLSSALARASCVAERQAPTLSTAWRLGEDLLPLGGEMAPPPSCTVVGLNGPMRTPRARANHP